MGVCEDDRGVEALVGWLLLILARVLRCVGRAGVLGKKRKA